MKRPLSRQLLTLLLTAALPADIARAAVTAPADDIAAYMRMMWGLLIVLAIILVLYALVKKRFSILNPRSGRSIRVLEIQPLMPRKSLCLVEVKGKEYLLGVGNETITLLAALDAAPRTPFQEVLETSKAGRQS